MKSISPDRVSKSPDKSLDKQSYISGENTDYSRKSTLSNISELEGEIWKNIKNNLSNKINYNIINVEERNEFYGRVKDIKLVLGKYLQYFILESGDSLENFLNKLNQKTENEIEFDFQNDIRKLNKNNINNIKIQKDETKKQRKLDNNIININNFNLEKKNEEDKNEIKKIKNNDNENFLGIFEDEKEEKDKKEKKINNNWMDITNDELKSTNSNNIHIISEPKENEKKREISSHSLKYNNKIQLKQDKNKNINEISTKDKTNELKSKNDNNNNNQKEKEENKIENIENQKEDETIRKKSEVIKRKKKIVITFE